MILPNQIRNEEVLVQIERQALISPSLLLLPNKPEKGDWINFTEFPQSDRLLEGQEQYSLELLQHQTKHLWSEGDSRATCSHWAQIP